VVTHDMPKSGSYRPDSGFFGRYCCRTGERLERGSPVVIDMKADPNVIALPPHASPEQIKNLYMALARGDTDPKEILAQIYIQWAV
jgi:hypothetical protein